MKKLLEMSQLVTDFVDEKRLKSLFHQESYDPKAYKLLEGIIVKKYADDKEAAYDIYKSSPSNKSYLMLKSRTRERMVNMLFTMDNSKRMKSNYEKALYQSSRNIIAARLLILRGMRNVAIDYLKSALTLSQKFQFTDNVLLSSRLLRMHEAVVGKEKKISFYDSIIKNSDALLMAEIEMEEYMQRIYIQLRNTVAPKDKLRQIATEAFKKSKLLFNKFQSHSLVINYYRISIFYHHINEQHEAVVKDCEDCEKYLNTNPVFTDHSLIAEMALQKLDTSLYLRDYELGKESASVCRQFFNPGYINWLIFLEYYFLLCLHTQNYNEAQKIFTDVIRHPKFSNYPPEHLEKWKIFEAFLAYILPFNPKQKSFNVFKFINEVPIFSKDKRGYNLSIIIAQIALLIKLSDFNMVMDKFNSLKTYAQRYISKKRNPRSFYFVKMLLLIVKYDFDSLKAARIGDKFFAKMTQSKIGNQRELETLEVIPYDILWQDLIEKLKSTNEKLSSN